MADFKNYLDFYKNNGRIPNASDFLNVELPVDSVINNENQVKEVEPDIIPEPKTLDKPSIIEPVITNSLKDKINKLNTMRQESAAKKAELSESPGIKDTEMEEALKSSEMQRKDANFMDAIGQMSTAIANLGSIGGGIKNNFQSTADAMMNESKHPIADLQAKREQFNKMVENKRLSSSMDPNSQDSIAARDLYKALGGKVSDKASASDIESSLKYLQQKYSVDEARRNRALELERIKMQKQDALNSKELAKNVSRIDTFAKRAQSEIASSRGPLGQAALKLQSIAAAKALVDGTGNLDDIDSRQMVELAKVLDRTLSGGAPTISGTEHLTPVTAQGKIKNLLEKYVTNRPEGANQGKFVERIMHTFDREEEVSKKAIEEATKHAGASLSDIGKLPDGHPNKEQLRQTYSTLGFDGNFDDKGNFHFDKKESSTHAPNQDVIDYYNEHKNIFKSIDEAQAYLKRTGQL